MKMKFWDKEEKRMMGPDLDTERYRIISYNGLALIDDEREDEDGWPYQMDVEFLRPTGLKDKNGKEVYEGDIIDVDCDCDPGEYACCSHDPWRGYVAWHDEYSSFELFGLDHSPSTEAFESHYEDVWTVVGNIYENPELLE